MGANCAHRGKPDDDTKSNVLPLAATCCSDLCRHDIKPKEKHSMTYLRQAVLSTLLCATVGAALAADGNHTEASATENPDATVEFSGGTIAAGVGFVWGHGSLTFQGQKHDFKLSGLSIVDVGAAHLTGSGVVYNLRDLSDFNGTYTAAAAGITIAGGGSAAVLRNQHGVVIRLISTTEGLRFNLSANGVDIKLKS
jgi:hypothetical protein